MIRPAGSLPDVTRTQLGDTIYVLQRVASHAPDVDDTDRQHIRYAADILDELRRAGGLWIDTTD
jgi:hypothetical protein